MLAFLCSCAFLPTVDASIYDWAASCEGTAFAQQALKGFYEQETMQQTSLRILALLSFENLLPPQPWEMVDPVHGCYLSDFASLLRGETIDNRRAVIRRMACSLRRVVHESSYPALGRFFAIMEADEPLHLLDGLSDKYWESKAKHSMDHEGAWSMAWGELHDNLDQCGTNDQMKRSRDDQDEEDCFIVV